MKRIIAAGWLLPIVSQPIKNGIITTDDCIIKIVAPEVAFRKEYGVSPQEIENYQGYVILPAFVNAHTHLIFNSLNNRSVSRNSFSDWVGQIIEYRNRISSEEIASAINASSKKMYRQGISLVGNICSDFFGDGDVVDRTGLRGVNYLEVAGFAAGMGKKLEEATDRLNNRSVQGKNFRFIASPHSVYSCEADLIRKLKVLSEETGQPFSIHLAESEEETKFTINNSGSLKDFLVKRGMPAGFLEFTGLSPVKYLNSIGGCHYGMIAVHCVHIDDEDINILSENCVRIVTCPGSNRFLGNGIAPLEKILDKGILVSIGTDSAGSNEELDIFREMRIIKEDHPSIPSSEIIKMATINGARAIGFDDAYGTIETGKKADLIALPLPETAINWDAGQVENYIVKECHGEQVIRINLQE